MNQHPEPSPNLSDYLKAWPQYLLPTHALSRVMHALTRSINPLMRCWFMRWFVKQYGVDMSLAQEPNLDSYANFNDFFTRALRPEARPVVSDEKAIACPVDGAVSQAGAIHDGRIFQAKSQDYSLLQLLGGDEQRAKKFTGGNFATLYLSPRDYHRIHMPLAGKLTAMSHVPGRLFSVNAATARIIPGLFARNERVITYFDTEAGPMAMVLVGAIFVASIETVWAGEITPPAGKRVRHWDYQGSDAREFARGEEMGRFNMGSTVIVLFGRDAMQWTDSVTPDAAVQMGQQLGTCQT
ncbi:MAG: archaetidylserine decarboxylase [Gammaproteobacteria bacterium]|nr:archaetidylserine decarboxylase [Gammaproteobacteria bacterium]MCF6362902.1 archaetidylserine decarboxylase [Gammaproteobacteria bacterium]